ncbi:glycoside hydrolase family 95 protein [Aureibaculum luteum]|uniref:glycoside hydrolase family 95 protein n=1 Tax=Aureibaculum luteum TaxID=1548456 RepID=UPI000E4D3BA5|nr:glycoside hydrolase family 95 protein [Aureibaculum luteum]
MRKPTKILIIFIVFFALISCQKEEVKQPVTEIWYAQPATKWMEALPVGNGRLGAMVFGDPNHERIQLNEDSLWPGGPDWGNSKGNKDDLEQIRELLAAGKAHEVDQLIIEKFSYKSVLRSHQTMGDLFIDFEGENEVTNYKRSLDFDNAIAKTVYDSNGYQVTQKVFASNPDDVLIVTLESKNPEGLSFTIKMNRPEDNGHKTVEISNPSEKEISMKGMVTQYGGKKFSEPFPIDYGVKFETRLKVNNNSGEVIAKDGILELKNVKQATLYVVANTSFYHDDYETENTKTLTDVTEKSIKELLDTHKKDYQELYNRVDFNLGDASLDSLPTDVRLKRIKEGNDDPDLAAKLFKYGRYLLIASSREGTNPANLQGLWNEHIQAPWNADYHLNINLQMNYWPAEVTNLSELHTPFFNFLDKVFDRGRITVKEQYGIERGTVAHHATDLWATPWMRAERAYWGAWIHGGGWSGQHYWEHYQFTEDKVFLEKRAYPTLKSLSEFYLDWLVWDEKSKTWVSSPDSSPENSYLASDGKPAAISFGSAMGHQIIGEVFDNTLAAAEILGIDDDFVKELKAKKEKLHPGVVIGEDGRILEWNEPYEEPEKGHRHMSHLYALHPGDDITSQTKEAFAAAQKTIDYRLEHGGAGTGWSRAWMINMNARLLNAKSAEENIAKFMQISVADNLFDEHPPFQIDGNFGYTAGVAECLLQSHEGFLMILPSLPNNWKIGNVEGLKARGNIIVDIVWEDGLLKQLNLVPLTDKLVKIKYSNKEVEIQLIKNKKTSLNESLEEI